MHSPHIFRQSIPLGRSACHKPATTLIVALLVLNRVISVTVTCALTPVLRPKCLNPSPKCSLTFSKVRVEQLQRTAR